MKSLRDANEPPLGLYVAAHHKSQITAKLTAQTAYRDSTKGAVTEEIANMDLSNMIN